MNNQVFGVGLTNAMQGMIKGMQPELLQMGKIKTINPISVQLTNGLVIPSGALYINKGLLEKEYNINYPDKVNTPTLINDLYIDFENQTYTNNSRISVSQSSEQNSVTVKIEKQIKENDLVMLAVLNDGQTYIIMSVLKKL